MIQSFKELQQELMQKKNEPKKVAVVKAASRHALESIFELAEENLVIPYLIGDEEAIKKHLSEITIKNASYIIVHAETDTEAAFKGIQLAKEGQVEFIMKGDLQTGTLLKEVVNHETGIRKQKVLSHLALIEVPAYPKLIGVTDGGMVLTPDIEQKKAIIKNASEVMQALGYQKAKFAVLSAAEVVQPKLPASVDAAELTKEFSHAPDMIVEGPISLDIALSPEAAGEKRYQGKIQGDTDVLVAPDIVSGNALSKSMTLLAGGKMAGIIVGAEVPIILTSRSSSAAEKRNSLLLALKVSQGANKKGVSE
ncbi:MAG: phosphate acyltransferase [Carnobacterium sp.]|uniref:Phosphate acyltransferase n=1 Tax=Carnobacterium antarcticum TaxID=2126436 RepID=A0ABW4NLC9_9LACT|nr:phosphate acyltransferase [Carnobacterium sp. CS13]QQP69990.1 phosphate acetyl/butyryl transferase [Carnobacterium sp. CS13]